MPVQTQLLRDGRVLLNTYTEPLEMPEISAMVDRVNQEFFDKAVKPLHTIDDLTLIKDIPPNIISGARPILPKRHPMAGHGYIVVKPGLLSIIARTLLNVISIDKLRISDNLEEALSGLDQVLHEEASHAS